MLVSMNTTDTILTGDCLNLIPTIPAGSVHLAYFDPPFNIGMDYPVYDDRRPKAVHLALIENTLRELPRVLSPSGSLWVQCGQTIQAEVFLMLAHLGLHWRNSVVWDYEFGVYQTRKFTPSWQSCTGSPCIPSTSRSTPMTSACHQKGRRSTTTSDRTHVAAYPATCGTSLA
jgi:DNA modification methylase